MSQYLTITIISYVTLISVLITLPANSANNEDLKKLARFTGVKEPYEAAKKETAVKNRNTTKEEYENTTDKEDYNYNLQKEAIV